MEHGQLCDVCDEPVLFSDILVHLISHVGPLYVLECPNPKCPHMFTSYKSLQNHFQGKVNRNRFRICGEIAREKKILWTCKTCGFVADTHRNLRNHLEDLHELDNLKEKNYECPVIGCGKKFAFSQSVNFHLQKHRYSSTDFQDCEICGENWDSDFIEEHLKESHEIEEVHSCIQCPFKFVSRNALLKHMRCHLHIGLLCNVCNDQNKYMKWGVFREHCHYKHGDPLDKIKCEWCEDKFWKKEDAYTHATAKHKDKDELGLGQWKCEVEGCGKRFKRKKEWEGHKKFH